MGKTIFMLFALPLLFLGCDSGPRRAEVVGTVKLHGRLIDEGVIQFNPVEGNQGPSAGEAIRNGKYHLPKERGALVGKNQVEIRGFYRTGNKVQDAQAPEGTLRDEIGQLFPPEYNEKSTLIRTIEAGTNIIDFDIQLEQKLDKK